jgi:hypothetical protein
MDDLINSIVRVVDARDSQEAVVEVRLAELVSVTVDLVKTFHVVNGDKIRGQTDMVAVALVQLEDP